MTLWTWPRTVTWPPVRAFPLSNGRWRRRFGRPRSWIIFLRLRIQSISTVLTRCPWRCSRFNLLRLHIDIVWSHSRQRRRSISWFLKKYYDLGPIIFETDCNRHNCESNHRLKLKAKNDSVTPKYYVMYHYYITIWVHYKNVIQRLVHLPVPNIINISLLIITVRL